jgi:uncharacterized protein (DUF736 family)
MVEVVAAPNNVPDVVPAWDGRIERIRTEADSDLAGRERFACVNTLMHQLSVSLNPNRDPECGVSPPFRVSGCGISN